MRKQIEQIEIKEPPIQELKKQRSCLKRSCFTGCGCIIIFIVATLLLVRFSAGPRPKIIKKLPDNFPTNIPIYDGDNINKVSFTSGKARGRGLEIVAFIPKLILSPVILMLDNGVATEKIISPEGKAYITKENSLSDLVKIIKKPISNKRDVVKIEWSGLTAEPRFVQAYYQTELKNSKYEVDSVIPTDKNREISFKLDNIDGVIYIDDNPDEKGTDYVSLTVNLPEFN